MKYWFFAKNSITDETELFSTYDIDHLDAQFVPHIGALVPDDDILAKRQGSEWRVAKVFDGEIAEQLSALEAFENTFDVPGECRISCLVKVVANEAFKHGKASVIGKPQ